MRTGRIFYRPQADGLLGRVLAFVLSAVLLGLAFVFSLVALSLVAVGAAAVGGWLWWKTRSLRKTIRRASEKGSSSYAGNVIDGEAVRADEPHAILPAAERQRHDA